jgi:hypothetical protein
VERPVSGRGACGDAAGRVPAPGQELHPAPPLPAHAGRPPPQPAGRPGDAGPTGDQGHAPLHQG